jgi:hypothetical protein
MCNPDALKNPFKGVFGGSPRDHLKRAIDKTVPLGLPSPSEHLAKRKPSIKPDKTWGPYGAYTSSYDVKTKTALGG